MIKQNIEHKCEADGCHRHATERCHFECCMGDSPETLCEDHRELHIDLGFAEPLPWDDA